MHNQNSDEQIMLAKRVIAAEAEAMRKIFEAKKKELHISQASLARDFRVKPPSIFSYLNGKTQLNMNFASFFAKQLQVSLVEFSPRLAKKIELMNQQIGFEVFNYPILEKNQIEIYPISSNETKRKLVADNSHPSNIKLNKNAFWLRLDNDEMHPNNGTKGIMKGSLILIDPDIEPQLNELALLKIINASDNDLIKLDHRYLFRLITHDGCNLVAKALNNDYPSIELNKNTAAIVGKVVAGVYPDSMFTL